MQKVDRIFNDVGLGTTGDGSEPAFQGGPAEK
jgi:hypothetical protein